MRFALITTLVAAAFAVPMAGYALAPQMSPDQFISAVRCVAYEDALSPRADLAVAKWRLNAEATRQSPETNSRAHWEVSHIAREIALSSAARVERLGGSCWPGSAQV